MRPVRAILAASRRLYGSNPLHLLVLLAAFALAAYGFYRASFGPLPLRMLVWFLVAIVGHDLVLYPLYALADRSWHVVSRRTGLQKSHSWHEPSVPAVNYVRVPTVLSGVLLIAFWGTISGEGEGAFLAASDHHFENYLGRWLGITGVFFAVSAVLYAWRLGRARTAGDADRRPSPTDPGGQAVR